MHDLKSLQKIISVNDLNSKKRISGLPIRTFIVFSLYIILGISYYTGKMSLTGLHSAYFSIMTMMTVG